MRKFLGFLLNIIIYVAIVAGIVYGLPRFLIWRLGTEYPIAAITSGSMWPALKTGDIVLIKKIDRNDIKVGDIIVWQNEAGAKEGRSEFTIHRVVALDPDTLTTKGDANFSEDPPVKYADVIGRTVYLNDSKPFRIPYFGFISVWAGGKFRTQI